MPDGTVVKDVPSNATQAEVWELYRQQKPSSQQDANNPSKTIVASNASFSLPIKPGTDLIAGLNQTPGISNLLNKASSIVGTALPSTKDLTSNIRLNTSGLASLGQAALAGLGAAATVATVANLLKSDPSKNGLTGLIGGALATSAIGTLRNIANQGSGIGKGATISITPRTGPPGIYTSNELKQGLDISSTSLSAGSVSNAASVIGSNIINTAKDIGGAANNIIKGVGDKINSLTSMPTDPNAIAAKVGLDPTKLSGLVGAAGIGGLFQSKLPSQVTAILDNIPKNVNLEQLKNQGLVLDFIPVKKIGNIPAAPPFATAPIAQPDPAYLKQVVAQGGPKALQNLFGVNSMSKLSTNLVSGDLIASAEQSLSNERLNPFGNLSKLTNGVDITAFTDKVGSVKAGLTSLPGFAANLNIPDMNITGSVADKFGSSLSIKNPIASLIGNTPLSPPYSGTDPSIRSRLGMPSLGNASIAAYIPSVSKPPTDLTDFYG